MTLFKLPFLLLTVHATHTTFTAPQKSPSSKSSNNRIPQSTLPLLIAPLLKAVFITPLLLECILLLGPSIYAPYDAHAHITPVTIFGTILSLMGARIRKACYTTLGANFTFELGIQKDQKLITTGPYSIVRHPSYTGAALNALGTLIVLTGSWGPSWDAWDYDMLVTWGAVWVVMGIVGLFVIVPRLREEDALLHNQFGLEWERWRERVPYSLVPYIL